MNKLREAQIHINQGIPIAETSRKIGITDRFGGSSFFDLRIEIWIYDETEDIIASYSDL